MTQKPKSRRKPEQQPKDPDQCDNCHFWAKTYLELPEGRCRHGPQFYNKRNDDWCGQHKPKASEERITEAQGG